MVGTRLLAFGKSRWIDPTVHTHCSHFGEEGIHTLTVAWAHLAMIVRANAQSCRSRLITFALQVDPCEGRSPLD